MTEAHESLRVLYFFVETLKHICADTNNQGTVASQKHELLFSRFGLNYNDVPERYRKGSVLVRDEVRAPHRYFASESLVAHHAKR